MPTVFAELPLDTEPRRKLWTREEYWSLESVLPEQKLELVEGELINKMGKRRPHVSALVLLQEWLVVVFGARFVEPEAPIDVSPEDNPTSEPEPDLIVTRHEAEHYDTSNPGPEDLLLVVEIADWSLGHDLTRKAGLYARARISEYWVVDIRGRRIIVHRSPAGGHYQELTSYSETDSITPLAAPESRFPVNTIFRRIPPPSQT